jgi:biopolymer transport protein ExbB
LLLCPIALVSFAIWGYYVRSREHLNRTLQAVQSVQDVLMRLPAGMGSAELEQRLVPLSGPAVQVVRRVLATVQRGRQTVFQAFDAPTQDMMRSLSRDLIILSAVTAAAPLLGLLGTVIGMIQTFDAVSVIGGQTGARVASGISKALITTQFGLVVAVPGVFGLSRLRRRLGQVEVRMAECRAYVVTVLSGGTR